MANHKETTLVKELATTRAQPPCGGEAAPTRRGHPVRFTDEELTAAQQLVLLSESSSEDVAPRAAASRSSSASSSSLPSVSNTRVPPPEEPMAGGEEGEEEEEMLTGPRVRRPRYRGICGLYAATSPIGGGVEGTGAAQHRKKSRR
ncbi:hypothetical protein Taro_002986 [Colocasia esculenta]|uniref:Uncharacterized protein n=1 Tax=Colocasia esculenta TaxID=4460 RepID=A0A843TEB4_COLES|nr:hypothetical protein [Colocasia esculenta]